MNAMASQTTGTSIVDSTVYSLFSHCPLWRKFTGHVPIEFPPQRASNAEHGSIWWRHSEVFAGESVGRRSIYGGGTWQFKHKDMDIIRSVFWHFSSCRTCDKMLSIEWIKYKSDSYEGLCMMIYEDGNMRNKELSEQALLCIDIKRSAINCNMGFRIVRRLQKINAANICTCGLDWEWSDMHR